MNASGLRLTTSAAIFVGSLLSNSLIFESERPLRPGLAVAIERQMVESGAWEHLQFAFVVRIHGACRVPSPLEPIDLARPLGWVDRVDGQMLPIVHVDCLRIGQALRRIVVDPWSAETREMFARAIARVIRHEVHHLSMNTSEHEKRGENKAALRAEELAAPITAGLSLVSKAHE